MPTHARHASLKCFHRISVREHGRMSKYVWAEYLLSCKGYTWAYLLVSPLHWRIWMHARVFVDTDEYMWAVVEQVQYVTIARDPNSLACGAGLPAAVYQKEGRVTLRNLYEWDWTGHILWWLSMREHLLACIAWLVSWICLVCFVLTLIGRFDGARVR